MLQQIKSLSSWATSLTSSNNNNLTVITDLLSFFKSIYSQLRVFSNEIKIPSTSQVQHSLIASNLNVFYISSHNVFKKQLTELSNVIEMQIYEPLCEYNSKLKNDYDKVKHSIQTLIENTTYQHKQLETVQKDYYSECEKGEQMENKSMKSLNIHSENLDEIHLKLNEQKRVMNAKAIIYQKHVDVVNKILNEHKKECLNIQTKVNEIEEERMLFIKTCIEKYLKYTNDVACVVNIENEKNVKNFTMCNDISQYSGDMSKWKGTKQEDNDIDKWESVKFQKYSDMKVFSSFEIIDNNNIYDINDINDYVSNNDNSNNNNQNRTVNNKVNISDEKQHALNEEFPGLFPKQEAKKKEGMYNYTEFNFIPYKTSLNNNDIKIKQTLLQYMNMLSQDETIQPEHLSNFFDLIDTNANIDFYRMIIESFYESKPTKYYCKFTNYTNMMHFSNIVKKIAMSLDINELSSSYNSSNSDINTFKAQSFEIIDKIISIGMTTYCGSTYLCSLLSQNHFFDENDLWVNLVYFSICKRLNHECIRLIRNRKKSSSSNNQQILHSLTSFIKSTAAKVFTCPIDDFHMSNDVLKYKELSYVEKRQITTDTFNKCVHISIKYYINAMSSYNINLSEVYDVIIKTCTKYKLMHSDFFIVYLNTSCFTIRKHLHKLSRHTSRSKAITEKLSEIKQIKSGVNNSSTIVLKYPNDISSTKAKVIILNTVFKYLPNIDIVKLMMLNKDITKNINRKVYKYLLEHTKHDINKHLKVWKSMLMCSTLSKCFNYNIISKALQQEEAIDINDISNRGNSKQHKHFNIITLDVKRTHLKSKDYIEMGRKAIERILKAFVSIEDKIGYCQGMNYVCAFLYEITKHKEDDCFYILLGLVSHSKWENIFVEDMKKMTNYFYVLKRLIYLYMPELVNYFNQNGVLVRSFASPWFITLFTSFYQYNENVESKVLVEIWDDFLLRGWPGIFSSLLVVLKYNYDKILKCTGDEPSSLLINNLVKSEIFNDENYEKFLELKKEFKFTPEFIHNLEDEIECESRALNIQEMYLLDRTDEEV